MKFKFRFNCYLLLSLQISFTDSTAQIIENRISINVDIDSKTGSIQPILPDNHLYYSYTKEGKKQLSEMLEISSAPLHERANNLLVTSGEKSSLSETIKIEVNPDAVLTPLSDDFVGFGYETSAVANHGYFSAKNTHFVQLYRTLGKKGLVRIGGNIGDNTRFEAEGKLAAQASTGITVINRTALEDLGGFLRATGWKALWTLNLGTGTKEEAVAEALEVQAALGNSLVSFEIGNEVDLLKRFKDYAGYHAAYLEYKAAVRAVLPNAIFSGPDVTAGGGKWVTSFAETESKDMKLLLQHYYRCGQKSADATLENLLAPHPELNEMLHLLQEICIERNIAFRINEVNSFFGGGKPGISDTYASSLWCLDYMFRVASYGGVGVNMETDVNHLNFVSSYSPIFRDESGKLSARPEYYGMLAFALAGKGNLVKINASKSPVNMTAYASKSSDGPVWVTLINRDLASPVDIQLVMPKGYNATEIFRLAAPSIYSKNGVTLAGASVSPEGKWSPTNIEKVSVKHNGMAEFTLPATSAVLVRLQ